MSQNNTPRFKFPYLGEGQANAETKHNEALDFLAGFLGLYIEDRDLTAPPSITDGQVYLVPTGATGLWSGQDGKLAFAINQGWVFKDNENGTPFYMVDEGGGGFYLNGYNFRNMGPKVALRRAASLALTGETNVEWDTQIAIDGHFTHDTGSNPEQIGIVDAGLHEILAQVTFEVTSALGTFGTQQVRLRAYDATSIIPGAIVDAIFDDRFGTHTLTLSRMDSLSNAYVKITAEHVAGGATIRIAATGSYCKVSRP